MEHWHDTDEFWEALAPVLFSSAHMKAAPEEAKQVVQLLSLEPGTAILDVCCGPGRHSLELARLGFRVTGIDRTAAYLEKARRTAEAEGLAIELLQEDARTFLRPGRFDGAVNLYTSFGYFEDPAEDKRVLENVLKSLREGGVFVMELMGKEVLARIFRERDWHEVDGITILEERRVSRHWTWIENRWILLSGDQRQEFHLSHRLYSAGELTELFRETGFRGVEVFGDLAGAPYDHNAKRLVLRARK